MSTCLRSSFLRVLSSCTGGGERGHCDSMRVTFERIAEQGNNAGQLELSCTEARLVAVPFLCLLYGVTSMCTHRPNSRGLLGGTKLLPQN